LSGAREQEGDSQGEQWDRLHFSILDGFNELLADFSSWSNETIGVFGTGDGAFLRCAEPTIPISGYPLVHPVPQETGNQQKDFNRGPGKPQVSTSPQGCGGIQVGAVAFHENNAGKMIRWQSSLCKDTFSRCGLQWSEEQVFARVSLDEEPHETVTQIADAIKEEYAIICCFVGFSHCLVG
jgi:hypothetical protein